MYIIYRDGRVYSKWFGGRFLKLRKHVSKRGTGHYYVSLGKRKRYQISRLVKFHFDKHNFKNIEDMPPLIFLDDNTSNFDLDNLKYAKKGEIITKIHRLYPHIKSKITANAENIKFIIDSLNTGDSLDRIGEHFGVSGMSVHRFKKRNRIL